MSTTSSLIADVHPKNIIIWPLHRANIGDLNFNEVQNVVRFELLPPPIPDKLISLEVFLRHIAESSEIKECVVVYPLSESMLRKTVNFFIAGGIVRNAFDRVVQLTIENLWIEKKEVLMLRGMLKSSPLPLLEMVKIKHQNMHSRWINSSLSWVTLDLIVVFQPVRVLWLLNDRDNSMHLNTGEFKRLHRALMARGMLDYILNNSFAQLRRRYSFGPSNRDTLEVIRQVHKMKNIKSKVYNLQDSLKSTRYHAGDWIGYLTYNLSKEILGE